LLSNGDDVVAGGHKLFGNVSALNGLNIVLKYASWKKVLKTNDKYSNHFFICIQYGSGTFTHQKADHHTKNFLEQISGLVCLTDFWCDDLLFGV
jgi:hypothetical protein